MRFCWPSTGRSSAAPKPVFPRRKCGRNEALAFYASWLRVPRSLRPARRGAGLRRSQDIEEGLFGSGIGPSHCRRQRRGYSSRPAGARQTVMPGPPPAGRPMKPLGSAGVRVAGARGFCGGRLRRTPDHRHGVLPRPHPGDAAPGAAPARGGLPGGARRRTAAGACLFRSRPGTIAGAAGA